MNMISLWMDKRQKIMIRTSENDDIVNLHHHHITSSHIGARKTRKNLHLIGILHSFACNVLFTLNYVVYNVVGRISHVFPCRKTM